MVVVDYTPGAAIISEAIASCSMGLRYKWRVDDNQPSSSNMDPTRVNQGLLLWISEVFSRLSLNT